MEETWNTKVGLSTDSAICIWPLVAQLVRNLPAIRETWVRSLGWKVPLEKGKATHSSFVAWRIPWTGEFLENLVHGGDKELDTTEDMPHINKQFGS